MASETQYTANTGIVTISTANSLLPGDGAVGTVLTAASSPSNGTLIKTVTIKAQDDTDEGMVRLYITGTAAPKLIAEVKIPAITQSAINPTFEATIPLNFILNPGWILKASTEKGNAFNIIAEAQDFTYYTSSVRAETTQYTGRTGAANISTANSYLDGTGDMSAVIDSTSGCNIQSVIIKSMKSSVPYTTTPGMVRLFINDGGGSGSDHTKLLTEVPIPAVTQSPSAPTFFHRIVFENGFALKSGYKLYASTEKGDYFNVVADYLDWAYPA